MATGRPGLPSDLTKLARVQSEGSRFVLGNPQTSRGTWFREPATTFTSFVIVNTSIVVIDMASVVRPALLRQTCRAATSKRTLSTKLPTTFLPRTKVALDVPRQAGNAFVKNALANSTRVAAFHASGRKALLPAGPRTLNALILDV